MSIQRRLYDCASIGGPYVDAGLRHDQANAHYGLIHATLDELTAFAREIPDWQDLPFVSLVAMIVKRNEGVLAARAAVMQWTKRKAAYEADRASWKAAKPEKGIGWRALPMTASQRYLIADTALILEIEVPEGLNRGMASDWLEANGAHLINRLGGDSA
jgi:hypothetical protein